MAQREQDCRALEEELQELQDKTELALIEIEREKEERDADLLAANEDIKQLDEERATLQETNDRLEAEISRAQAEYLDDRDRLQALNQGFKDVRIRVRFHR